MQNFFAAGASFFVRLGILLVLLLVAAITAGYFIVSQVLAGIAIALGPVFLPWLLIERLSFIANGWIKFLVTAGVMKVVGVVMLSFGSAMTDSLAQVGRAMSGQENAQVLDLVGASVTLFVSIVMLMLSMQIPSIANGLVSGSVGSGLIFPRMPKPAGGGGNAPPKPPSKK
jgi:type IV secretory pathway TrbL component